MHPPVKPALRINLPMFILHVIEPFASGIALFVKSLTEIMPDDLHIIIHGERKKVMTAVEVKRNFPKKNVRFLRWRSVRRAIDPYHDLLALTELYHIFSRLKKKNMVDAVHLHSSKSGLLGRAASRMAGISNVIYTPNGASFLAARNPFSRFFYRQMEKIGHRLGGKVICCSISELEEYMRLGIKGGYINNGIDTGRQAITIREKRKGIFTIVTSGRIVAQKNPYLFNRIAARLQEMERIEFVWIGDGDCKKMLTSKNIRVTGWVDNSEVHQIVKTADMYLSTSLYEGLSFAVLEALAMKKPVLLSNCTGNSDIVKKGLNGDLFSGEEEAINRILQYYTNPEMIHVMGSYGEEICKKEFDVKQNFKLYRNLYEGLPDDFHGNPYWSFV